MANTEKYPFHLKYRDVADPVLLTESTIIYEEHSVTSGLLPVSQDTWKFNLPTLDVHLMKQPAQSGKVQFCLDDGTVLLSDAQVMLSKVQRPSDVVLDDIVVGPDRLELAYTSTDGGAFHVVVYPMGAGLAIDVYSTTALLNGLWGGTLIPDAQPASTAALPEGRIEMPGTLSVPTKVARKGDGTLVFASRILDITQSSAQGFDLNDPASPNEHATFSTVGHYMPDTAGNVRPLRERMLFSASEKVEDVFIHPSEKSDRLQESSGLIWTMITAPPNAWTDLLPYLEWRKQMGMVSGMIYPHAWWEAINTATGGQNNGQTWYPAADDAGFATFCAAAKQVGLRVGGYTLWGVQTEGTPSYNPNDRLLNADGSPRNTIWGPNKWMGREEAVSKYMDTYLSQCVANYGWNMVRYDVSTYGPPTIGNGNSIDATAGSHSGSLADAISARRTWMAHGRKMLNGPTFGEGSRIAYIQDMDYLYAGVVDGCHKWLNTNSGMSEMDPNIPASRTVSGLNAPIDYVWKAENTWSAHTGDNPARFFSMTDMADVADPGQKTLYPYSDKQCQRLAAFHIMLGRTGTLPLHGTDWARYMTQRQQVRQYYTAFAMTQMMRLSGVPEIHYFFDGAYMTFEEAYAADTDIFVEARVRLTFPNGIVAHVNRSVYDWEATSVLGVPITLPPDGYFVTGGDNNTLFGGHCRSAYSGGGLVSFLWMPGQLFVADGHGEVQTFLNRELNGGLLADIPDAIIRSNPDDTTFSTPKPTQHPA